MREAARKAAAALQKRLGPEAVSTTASAPSFQGTVIPTGSIGLDAALGIGGFPLGRIVEVYGPESGGKTTLTLHTLANAQKMGLLCGFVDAEHALDLSYAKTLGISTEDLLLSQPGTGEEGLNVVKEMVAVGVKVIVVDSVSALTPKAEIEGDVGDTHVGLQARMMGQALRMLTGKAKKAGATVIFINQLRQKIGVMFGSNETTSGGQALKFYASVRVDVRNVGKIKQSGQLYGHRCRLKVVKNKLAPPFKQVETDMIWGRGLAMEAQLLDIGAELELIEKSGNWFSFNGQKLGNGRPNAIDALTEKPKVRAAIEKAIRKAIAAGAP